MSKIGKYRFPTITLSNAIGIADLIIKQFRGSITTSGLAQALDMAEKGGGFLHKMSALREYGLVEGRGEIRTTELAERIVLPDSAADASKAAVDAFLGVELLTELDIRLGDDVPEVERMAILLGEITRDRIQSRKNAHTIRRIYADYVTYLKDAHAVGAFDQERSPPVQPGGEAQLQAKSQPSGPIQESQIELRAGKMHLSLPLTAASIDIVESALAVIRRQLEEENTTSDVKLLDVPTDEHLENAP